LNGTATLVRQQTLALTTRRERLEINQHSTGRAKSNAFKAEPLIYRPLMDDGQLRLAT
jgi:hypothetical protein